MRKILVFVSTALLLSASWLAAQTPKPKRINKAIELLEQGQPIYYVGSGAGDYETGKKMAQTPADYIDYGLEHGAFDMTKLRDFMRGLVDGGPTKSGHRTPTVIVNLPIYAISADQMYANAWVIQQVLATGVHGILLCQANEPEAVRVMVEVSRYPHAPRAPGLEESAITRGSGSQIFASQIWGVSGNEYMRRADPWPLNPDGEIMFGLKIENRHALSRAEELTKVPGIAFAEWGPGDMGLSFFGPATGEAGLGDRTEHPLMVRARSRVLAATKAAGIAFLNSCNENDVVDMIKEGVMICTGGGGPGATKGREFSKRPQPW